MTSREGLDKVLDEELPRYGEALDRLGDGPGEEDRTDGTEAADLHARVAESSERMLVDWADLIERLRRT